ncbi:MAG: hypothetical protein ACO398_03460 [Kiritimatiellia bacterium]|jgi:hypothetical protein
MNKTLKSLSVDEMLGEIKRRNRLIKKLNDKRAALLHKVAQVEEEIRNCGGEIKKSGLTIGGITRRPRNEMSLPDAMAQVMSKDKSMSVADIEEAVTKIGYKSTSSTFKTIIFQALAKDKRFKKASRGQYLLK